MDSESESGEMSIDTIAIIILGLSIVAIVAFLLLYSHMPTLQHPNP